MATDLVPFGIGDDEYTRRMAARQGLPPIGPQPAPAPAGVPPGPQPAPSPAAQGLPKSRTVGYNPQSAPRPPADILRQQYGGAYKPGGPPAPSRGPGKLGMGLGGLTAGLGALDIAMNGANANNVTNAALGAAALTPGLSPYATPLLGGKMAGEALASAAERPIVGAAEKLGALGNVQATGDAATMAQQVNAMTPKAQGDYWANKRQAMYSALGRPDVAQSPAAAGLSKPTPTATAETPPAMPQQQQLAAIDKQLSDTRAYGAALDKMTTADWAALDQGGTTPALSAMSPEYLQRMRTEGTDAARAKLAGEMQQSGPRPGTGFIRNQGTGKVTFVAGQEQPMQQAQEQAQRIPRMPVMLPFKVRPGAQDFGSALANMANYTALYNQLQQQQNQGIRDTDREWGRYKDLTGMGLENMAQNTSRINALTNQQELTARQQQAQQQAQQKAEQAKGDYKYLEAPMDLEGNPIGEESVFDPNTGVKRSLSEQQAFLRRQQIQQLVDSGAMTPEEAQKALGG